MVTTIEQMIGLAEEKRKELLTDLAQNKQIKETVAACSPSLEYAATLVMEASKVGAKGEHVYPRWIRTLSTRSIS